MITHMSLLLPGTLINICILNHDKDDDNADTCNTNTSDNWWYNNDNNFRNDCKIKIKINAIIAKERSILAILAITHQEGILPSFAPLY